MSNDSAMVVLSGGQDSTTCLLWAKANYKHVHAITFNYGQRHNTEIQAAIKVAEIVGVASHEVVDVAGLLFSRSPLTDPSVPLETYKDFISMDATIGSRVELTFVPLRNPFFLLVAANHALSIDCHTLVTGVCQSDNANYPDCTEQFIVSMAKMMDIALGGLDIAVRAPLMHFSKAGTVELALSYSQGREALAYTHTCYAGEVPPCGKCHACVLRAEGFRQAGEIDPLVHRCSLLAPAAGPSKMYLGDSVYIERDGEGGLLLTTNNGGADSNRIFIDSFVAEALVKYIERVEP